MKTSYLALFLCCVLSSGQMIAKKKKHIIKPTKVVCNLFKLFAGGAVFADGFTRANNAMCNFRLMGTNNMSKNIQPIVKESFLALAYLYAGYYTGKSGYKGLKKNLIGL